MTRIFSLALTLTYICLLLQIYCSKGSEGSQVVQLGFGNQSFEVDIGSMANPQEIRKGIGLACIHRNISYHECKLAINEYSYRTKSLSKINSFDDRVSEASDLIKVALTPDYFDAIVTSERYLRSLEDITNILSHSNTDRVVFIHSCSFNVDSRSVILHELLNRIERSKLHEEALVFVLNYGMKLSMLLMDRYSWAKYYEISTMVEAYELPTLHLMHRVFNNLKGMKETEMIDKEKEVSSLCSECETCVEIGKQKINISNATGSAYDDCHWNNNHCCRKKEKKYLSNKHVYERQVLYLHTKGASYVRMSQGIAGWIDLLMYFLVDRHRSCDHLFRSGVFNVIGVEQKPYLMIFNGNFWWASSAVFMGCPWPESKYVDKYFAERFISTSEYPNRRAFIPWNSEYSLWDTCSHRQQFMTHHKRWAADQPKPVIPEKYCIESPNIDKLERDNDINSSPYWTYDRRLDILHCQGLS